MEVDNCNSHGDHGNVSPSTPQNDNDPTGHKKWYRQASQRLVSNYIKKFHHNRVSNGTSKIYRLIFVFFFSLLSYSIVSYERVNKYHYSRWE